MALPVPARARGRPAVGERVSVRLPQGLLRLVDDRAATGGQSRAETIRSLLIEALRDPTDDGVDRAQIERMLRLTPAERIRRMTDVVNAQRRLRGAALRRAQ